MKWPNTLTIIRHGESGYNLLTVEKLNSPSYLEFKKRFDAEFAVAEDDKWVSSELEQLAREVWKITKLPYSDYDTLLTENGKWQAGETGKKLNTAIPLPDLIYVSPYKRTMQTLEGLVQGWPELAKVPFVSEERIREHEYGLTTIYNDWRVYFALNPIQGILYKLDGDYIYRYLNGESKADVRARVRSFTSTLVRENAEQNILVVSHNIMTLSIRANLERWLPDKFLAMDKSDKPINCGVTIYRGDASLGKSGRLVLDKYNEKLY